MASIMDFLGGVGKNLYNTGMNFGQPQTTADQVYNAYIKSGVPADKAAKEAATFNPTGASAAEKQPAVPQVQPSATPTAPAPTATKAQSPASQDWVSSLVQNYLQSPNPYPSKPISMDDIIANAGNAAGQDPNANIIQKIAAGGASVLGDAGKYLNTPEGLKFAGLLAQQQEPVGEQGARNTAENYYDIAGQRQGMLLNQAQLANEMAAKKGEVGAGVMGKEIEATTADKNRVTEVINKSYEDRVKMADDMKLSPNDYNTFVNNPNAIIKNKGILDRLSGFLTGNGGKASASVPGQNEQASRLGNTVATR